MGFLRREIKLPLRLSVVLSNFVALVLVIACLIPILSCAQDYLEIIKKGWWPKCPATQCDDQYCLHEASDEGYFCMWRYQRIDTSTKKAIACGILPLLLFLILKLRKESKKGDGEEEAFKTRNRVWVLGVVLTALTLFILRAVPIYYEVLESTPAHQTGLLFPSLASRIFQSFFNPADWVLYAFPYFGYCLALTTHLLGLKDKKNLKWQLAFWSVFLWLGFWGFVEIWLKTYVSPIPHAPPIIIDEPSD